MAQEQMIKPVFDYSAQPNVGRMPPWVRHSLAAGRYAATATTLHRQGLHTVCEEARCPNRGECWSRGTATFMLLGDTCTRACGFCAVKTGRPQLPDEREPQRVADAVGEMGLGYVVLTSVNRDDLADGGAAIFAATLAALRQRYPDIGLEVLTPDFRRCQEEALETITAPLGKGGKLVWGHNMETVPSLYKRVRRGADYARSLGLLERAALCPNVEAKSALMLGLGERFDEVVKVLDDLRCCGVRRLVIGQYLRPTRYHLPVKEYIPPATFANYEVIARELGFTWVQAGAMARSSYHAET